MKHSPWPAPSIDVPTAIRADPAPSLIERPQWRALLLHYLQIEPQHLRELFADDPGRGERFAAEAAGLYLDYSKNRINDETLRLLFELAEACGVRLRTEAMFNGERRLASQATMTNPRTMTSACRIPRYPSLCVTMTRLGGRPYSCWATRLSRFGFAVLWTIQCTR